MHWVLCPLTMPASWLLFSLHQGILLGRNPACPYARSASSSSSPCVGPGITVPQLIAFLATARCLVQALGLCCLASTTTDLKGTTLLELQV